MYECILVSLDGSTEAEAVLPEVERLLKAHPGKVVLLRVGSYEQYDKAVHEMQAEVSRKVGVALPSDEVALLRDASEHELRRYLDAIGTRLQAVGATPVVEVSFSDPADEIVFFAKHYGADLIAMATHGRSGLNRLLHGSITESVLHRAPCPMLIVRTPQGPLTPFAPTN
jgi:nucleotide-binding universal stress UspA family protein